MCSARITGRRPLTPLRVFARYALAKGRLTSAAPALLLEGPWPEGSPQHHSSLDEAIDARHAWIDDEASRWAEQLADANCERPDGVSSTAYLNQLKLRYFLVKLLRIVAYFQETPPGGMIELTAQRRRDEPYAQVLEAICAAHQSVLKTHWQEGHAIADPSFPANAAWRRFAGKLNDWTAPHWPRDGRPRVVLCGARRVLDGVCQELVRRDTRVTWLYDRFAVRTWLRWRGAGVGQLVLSTSQASDDEDLSPPISVRADVNLCRQGVDLAGAVHHWLDESQRLHGQRQRRMWSRIDDHFARLCPDALMLDEDATPLARAAIDAARGRGVPSIVVQHGAPRVKFGFAPLAADYLFAWGKSSQRQFLRWGVPAERIRVTGWTGGRRRTSNIEHRTFNVERGKGPEILMFATTPPTDDRPDAVTFHLTTETHRRMLRAACAAVSRISGARLRIKLHPRCGDARVFEEVLYEFPAIRCRLVRRGAMRKLLRHAACVINCTSSAGIEAARLGVPVIELIPQGSLDLLPAAQWGALGTARDTDELETLLRQALASRSVVRPLATSDVFAAVGEAAAVRVADELMQIVARRRGAGCQPAGQTRHLRHERARTTSAKEPAA
jgi:hypothetical protein